MNPEVVEILLVEDSLSDAELTIRALRKRNLANNLIHLKNGAEALDFVFARGAYRERDPGVVPKVILLDLKMPKVNGLEVLAELRRATRTSTRTIPVVVLTSSKEDPDIDACYALGVNSYIVKPVEFDKFVKAVSELGFYWLLLNQSPPGTAVTD